MKGLNKDQEASAFFIVVGVVIIFLSLRYEHGDFSSPGPGFMGFWLGVSIFSLSTIGFVVSRGKEIVKKEKIFGPLWFNSFAIILSLVGYAFLLEFLGFLICTFLFIFVLLMSLMGRNWKVVWVCVHWLRR